MRGFNWSRRVLFGGSRCRTEQDQRQREQKALGKGQPKDQKIREERPKQRDVFKRGEPRGLGIAERQRHCDMSKTAKQTSANQQEQRGTAWKGLSYRQLGMTPYVLV